MKIIAISSEYKNANLNYRKSKINPVNFLSFKGQDLLELPENDVFTRIKESLTSENFLGQGTEAEVYRIKDTGYCVRIPYTASNTYRFNYSKELTHVDKINHVVAKLGFGASIMKYFKGKTPKENINNEFYRNKFQEKIAEMPLKSYTELLHQIADGINNEMLYDFSGGNLIVDFNNNVLTAIDFYEIKEDSRESKPLSEMYSVLTCYGSKKETGKKIFDKIVIAGLEEFMPGKIPCMDTELFDFVDLVLRRNYDNNDCRQKGINQFDFLKESISESFASLKKLKKAEIIDKTYSKLIEEKVIRFKKLILKVH